MRIIGVDSETNTGSPISFQFYGDFKKKSHIVFTNSKKSTKDFLSTLETLIPDDDIQTFLCGHNLTFDMVSYFHDRHVLFQAEEFSFSAFGWEVSGVYANLVFAKLTKGRRVIQMIDSHAYFATSLANLAKIYCPDLPKLKAPQNLGSVDFKKEDKIFVDYAMRDAEISYHIAGSIWEMHKRFKIGLCVSAPQFASKVFRSKHLKHNLPLPEKKITYGALHSYHGGKNNIAVEPGFYNDVYSYDIVSAYPAAMRELPSFYNIKLYKKFPLESNRKKPVPATGIYRIWGTTTDCKWPIIFSHAFKPIRGEVSAIWVTGFEINEGLRLKELTIRKIEGYYYDADADKEQSPFVDFVDYFYDLKSTATEKPDRDFYKVLLNSLYGKFIQTIDHDGLKASRDLEYSLDTEDLKNRRVLMAGGLFNPFIASMITGSVRAKIHGLEHKYKALHTATDGIFTQQKPVSLDELGASKVDCFGDLLLLRTKCYIIYGDKPEAGKKNLNSKAFAGKYILKYAHHGFYGTVFDMERMYVEGGHAYNYTKVNRLKESIRSKKLVNNFERRRASFNY